MKTPTYREAVEWIALNDDASVLNTRHIAGGMTTLLVADLFGIQPGTVARAVMKVRRAYLEGL